MITCLPQEDELITSHLSRLAHLNGVEFDRFVTLLTSTGRETKTHKSQSLEIYQRASALVGIASEEYLRCHTMAPIERFAARSEDQIQNFELPTPLRQRDTLLRLNLPINFCQLCAASELSSMGFSTWRRAHQIKGVEWCVIHGTPLRGISGSEAKHMQPHMVAHDEPLSFRGQDSWKRVEEIREYANFCVSALRQPFRFHRKEIATSIIHHYIDRRLITKPGSPGRRLSDLIKEHYPIAWLARHYPRLAAKATEEHCANIDRIVGSTPGIPGELYLLTLSCLFNDHKNAIAHIRSPLMKSRHHKPTLADMIDLWLQHKGNFTAISNSVGSPLSSVSTKFRSAGIPSSYWASDGQIDAVACFLRTSTQNAIEEWLRDNRSRFMALPTVTPATIARAAPLPSKKLREI